LVWAWMRSRAWEQGVHALDPGMFPLFIHVEVAAVAGQQQMCALLNHSRCAGVTPGVALDHTLHAASILD
jgi:hypothetical protein